MGKLAEDGLTSREPLVSGGGWQREPEPVHLTVSACLILASLAVFGAVTLDGALQWAMGAVSVVLVALAIVLWRTKATIDVPGPPDAGEDPYSLYLGRGSHGSSANDRLDESGPD